MGSGTSLVQGGETQVDLKYCLASFQQPYHVSLALIIAHLDLAGPRTFTVVQELEL